MVPDLPPASDKALETLNQVDATWSAESLKRLDKLGQAEPSWTKKRGSTGRERTTSGIRKMDLRSVPLRSKAAQHLWEPGSKRPAHNHLPRHTIIFAEVLRCPVISRSDPAEILDSAEHALEGIALFVKHR